jgi:hypothetical protein
MENKNDRIVNSVLASMFFGGLEPSEYAKQVGKDYLDGKISAHEAIKLIRANLLNRIKSS